MLKLLPWLVAVMIFLLARDYATGDTNPAASDLSIYNVLFEAKETSELYGTRFMILLLFLTKSLWPYNLSYDYSFNQVPLVGIIEPLPLLSALLYGTMLFTTLRGLPRRSPLAFGLAFYLMSSVVTSNFFFNIGAVFAERFLFLPAAGIIIAVTSLVISLKDQNPSFTFLSGQRAIYGVLFLLGIFVVLSMRRVPVWADNQTLHLSGLTSAPNSARVHFDVGSDYLELSSQSADDYQRSELLDESKREFLKSLEILPTYTDPLYNLGVVAIRQGDTLQAIHRYKMALATLPNHRLSLVNVAFLHLMRAEYDSSLSYLNNLMRYHPHDNDGYLNLSHLYYLRRDISRARFYAEEGIRHHPEVAFHYRNMAAALAAAGDTLGASSYFDQYIYRGGPR